MSLLVFILLLPFFIPIWILMTIDKLLFHWGEDVEWFPPF